MERVRKRLKEETFSEATYQKAEDPCTETLHQMNQQRQTEIRANQKLLDQLERQHVATKDELKEAKKTKRDLEKEYHRIQGNSNNKEESQTKVLLTEERLAEPPKGGGPTAQFLSSRAGKCLSTNDLRHRTFRRAPKGSMAEFLKMLNSS